MNANKKIEARIRRIAATKIKVRITAKVRSRDGFYVWHMTEQGKIACETVKTKRAALQCLLAKLRCYTPWEFTISRRLKHKGDK